jgi:hypothetical protein
MGCEVLVVGDGPLTAFQPMGPLVLVVWLRRKRKNGMFGTGRREERKGKKKKIYRGRRDSGDVRGGP